MKMTVEELITELTMTYSFSMHLLVEGDDDRKFFRSVLQGANKVNIVCCWGSDTVSASIEEIDKIRQKSSFLPTLGVIDRDYRIALGLLPQSPNLLATDMRDLECMMFASPTFETVLLEFGSDTKIQKFGGLPKVAVAAQEAASTVGKVRFLSQAKRLNVSFKDVDLSKILDRKTLTINATDLKKHINARQGSTGRSLTDEEFASADATCAAAKCDKSQPYFGHPLLLCRGHDLMEILAIACRSVIGSRSATESSRENFESFFRIGYVAHFRNTQLAKAADAWLRNAGLYPSVALI